MHHRIACVVIALGIALALASPSDGAEVYPGDPNDWTMLQGNPMWDSCNVITWSDDHGGVIEASLHRAIRKIRKITGLRFKRVPPNSGAMFQTKVVPQAEVNAVFGNVGGIVAAYTLNSYRLADNGWQIMGSTIVLSDTLLQPEYSGLVRNVYLHEAGHAVGLGHAANADEIMYPATTGSTEYGAGDRSGLAAVAPDQSCFRADSSPSWRTGVVHQRIV